ncbi:MAG: glycine zipper 2TM domain-containing protein [Minisyncoccia bacterium]
MKKQIICLACTVIALIGTPSSVYASDEGALLGGLTGGIICSNVGQGTGRSVAIAYCASIGAVLGDRMSNRQLGLYNTGQPTYYYSPYSYSYSYQQSPYSVYGMDVEAAKARGEADRRREEQRRAVDRAYWCGYHGTCE